MVIVDLLDVIHPLILKRGIDVIQQNASSKHLLWLAFLYTIIAIVKAIGRYVWRICFAGSSFRSAADLRYSFFSHLTKLSQKYFSKARSGDLISLATNDVDSFRMMMGPGLLILVDAVFYLAIVPGILIHLSPRLALYTFITLPFIPFIIAKMSNLVHVKWKEAQSEFAEVTTVVHENISGMRINKAYNTEEFEIKRLETKSKSYMKKLIDYAFIHALFHPLIELVIELGVVIFVILGGLLTIKGGVTLGLFVAFKSYIHKITWPMIALGWVVSIYNRAIASKERIEEVTSIEPAVKDLIKNKDEKNDLAYTKKIQGALQIRNLNFSYGKEPVLKNINLDVPASTILGITGEIGSGKSTLVQLIPRLFEVSSQTIFIDGKDIREYPLEVLRKNVAIVPQDVFLFSKSIKDNIAFAAKDLDEDSIELLLEQVSMKEEITILPGRLEAMLGEKGINLSGGQRQRLSLARALAVDASILILDDVFSAVDTEVEERILKGLESEFRKRTTIIVSHRLSTLKMVDQVIVLKNGEILEQGSIEALKANKGYFKTLFEMQQEFTT